MFTGLTEEIGIVRSIKSGAVATVTVSCDRVARDAEVGDSVCVSGVCLTVVVVADNELAFEAVPETLSRSTLADLRPGGKVNLESSLRAGKKIGGHFVQGHVDGVGTVEVIRDLGRSSQMRIAAPREVLRYVVEKGSIAIDGVSLTVVSCDDSGFAVALIPHTLATTTLDLKRPGDKVNLEADILGKYVEKFLGGGRASNGVTEDALRNAGFM
jgi:riboflavin synthase